MAQSLSQIMLHLIFSTKDREPIIPNELQDELYRYLASACNAHGSHVVGIHYDNVYTGTSSLVQDVDGNNNTHGDPATSTTVNCNICHSNTVTTAANDQNAVCATCHGVGSIALQGNMTIAGGATTHINGTPDVAFANINIRSRAQIRNDITAVTELDTYWLRNNGYKAGATSHDSSKATLSSTAGFNSGTCSTVACHNGNSVSWNDNSVSCDNCHTGLP